MHRRSVVVGAGVIGAAVALELARAGHEVVVADRGPAAGTGSTSASSAIVRYHYRHRDEAAIAWESGKRWARWGEYLGRVDPRGMARFVQTGLLLFAGEHLDMAAATRHLTDLGVAIERLPADQVAQRFPGIDPGIYGPPARPEDEAFWAERHGDSDAYWMPECGFVDDPQLAALNLAHAAEGAGVRFRFRSEVAAVLRNADTVTGLRLTTGEVIDADVVVNASGPWSATLNEMAGVLGDFTTSTRPLEQEVISLPAPPDFRLGSAPCVTDADLGTYFRPHYGSTIIAGGMEPDCDPLVWLDTPEAVAGRVTTSTWETQSLRVARRVPSIGVPNRPQGIVGVYDVTADWIPIYDRTSLDGYYVAIGTSGHGFKQAPFVGELMAHLIDACEAGHPHDDDPVQVPAPWTRQVVDTGHFSRRRVVAEQRAME